MGSSSKKKEEKSEDKKKEEKAETPKQETPKQEKVEKPETPTKNYLEASINEKMSESDKKEKEVKNEK